MSRQPPFDKRIIELTFAADPDATMVRHLVEATRLQRPVPVNRRAPSLRLLLAGYLGAGNVGSEVRCNEIVRQVRHLLASATVSFSAFAMSQPFIEGLVEDVGPLPFEGYVPDALARAVDLHDGVLACEGSMFKSNFSNVLSAVMAAALGMARRQGKIALGYGGEVGAMDRVLNAAVSEMASDAPIFCRNDASLDSARAAGLNARPGADTAWSFAPSPPSRGAALARAAGWTSGSMLMVCPANPFWWPVRADPRRAIQTRREGRADPLAYGYVFFHHDDAEAQRRYRRYVAELASAVRTLATDMGAHPVLVAMEQADEIACRDVAEALGRACGVVVAHRHHAGDVVALLRLATLLVSSRFHALVLALPALIPAIGIGNDERIGRLFAGHASARVLRADDPDLGGAIVEAVRRIDPTEVRQSSTVTVRDELRAMGRMGVEVGKEVRRLHPELGAAQGESWRDGLPELDDRLRLFLP